MHLGEVVEAMKSFVFPHSNIPMETRGKRADEYIQLLKKIWTDDVVKFEGEFYNIPASKLTLLQSK